MQTIVLLVWVLGASLALPDPDKAGEKVVEDPIPCSKGCICMHDDYSLELNMYCSTRNFTQVPTDMPPSIHSLWLDGSLKWREAEGWCVLVSVWKRTEGVRGMID